MLDGISDGIIGMGHQMGHQASSDTIGADWFDWGVLWSAREMVRTRALFVVCLSTFLSARAACAKYSFTFLFTCVKM